MNKRLLERLTRIFAPPTRFFALLFAIAAFGHTTAWAADPVAVWDRDFTATQTGYNLNRSNNAISQDNSTITIDQSVGVKVDFTTGIGAMTVMFRYSDLAFDAQKTLATSFVSGADENRTGVYLASGGTANGIANTGNWNNPMSTLSESSGVLAFTYSGSGGTALYHISSSGTRTQIYNKGNLRWGADTSINGCTIGGERAKSGATLLSAATGMKITSIAIFASILTESDMTSYIWPSEVQTIAVNANTSVSVIKAQLDSENYKAIAVSAADGVTITVDEAFGNIVSVSSVGSVKLAAAEQPATSYFSGVDFSGVQGSLVRSWITSNIVGFNFASGYGSDVSGALATADSWINDYNSANGTSTAMFADGLSTLTWASSTVYAFSGSTILCGYLDDGSKNGNGAEVRLSNVPYATYDIILYCSSDQGSGKHLAKTVNGTTYTWDTTSSTTVVGNGTWGETKTATPAYGTNALRIKNLTGPLTIYGSVKSGSNRGGIAAFEIIKISTHEATIVSDSEYTLTGLFTSVDENDNYVINVNESATLNIGSATTVHGITFNVASGKTLTLTGSSTLTSATINVNGDGTVAMTSSVLRGTVKGDGTVEYTSCFPSGATFDNSAWTGTVWIKGVDGTIQPNDYGNAQSKVKFSGVQGNFPETYTCLVPIELSNSGYNYGIYVKNGWSRDASHDRIIKLPKLKGNGAFWAGNAAANVVFHVTDWSEYTGSLQLANKIVVLGETVPAVSEFNESAGIYICSGSTVAIPNGVSYRADGGIRVKGTLKFVGSGGANASVTADANSTLDFSEASSGSHANAITLSSGTTIKLPAGATLPYQLATAGDGGLIDNVTVQIGDGTPVTGTVALSSGTITELAPVDIDTDKTYTVADVFGTPSAASSYEINVTSDATVTVPETAVGTILYNFTANGNTITLSGGYKIPAAAQYLKITDASTLTAGNYTLFQWTTPQQFTTSCAGYGRFASVDTTGLDSSLTAEVIYGAKAIYLRVYNTEAQAARKPLVIWPYGDSITEGFNQQHTGTNYRILLYQKLRMLGYNVKSTGVYDLNDGYNAVDPSGEPLSDADKWHSAKHGAPVSAGISGLAGRAALVENVDTLSVQAGTPDVVLLHIGVNDLSQTSDVDSVFEAWCDVVNRLVRNLPTSKIIVSTALYGRENQTVRNNRVASYNDKIKVKIADMPTEWVGHVVLADLCSLVDSNTTGILYSQDTVHPDWWGYDQMAEGWLEKIRELYNNPDATDFPSQAALPAIPDASARGAANKSELASYRAGFTKYGDVRVAHGQDIANIVYDNVDANAAASNIGRVGYFVEYVRTDNHAHKWVWVDMDAFGNRDIASIGLPAATQQHVVDRLHVYSNHGAIDNVAADDDTVKGFVEFTPYNIGAAASNIPGAPADSCPTSNQLDWNDTPSANGSGTYSSMQVFRIAPPSGRPAQTIFGFNNWRSFDTNPAEFGIGNFAQHFWSGNVQTLDYVHTRTSVKMNADAYTVKNIEIWTKPVYTATMSATGNFSGLVFSPTLPGDISACELIVNVTDDATLTFDFDAPKSVGAITFNIAANKTLTLDGTSNLTVGKVVVSGPGKIAFTASPKFGAMLVASNATIVLGSSQSIRVTGALTIDSGVTLTMEPASLAAVTTSMISAGSVVNNGTVALTAPDAGSDYSVIVSGTAVTLRRVTKESFKYNPVPSDNTPTGWITSWGGEPFDTTSLRVGPSSDIPYVYHVSSGHHPWAGISAKSAPFSIAFYADLSKLETGNRVLVAFGTSSNGLIIYKNDDAPGTVRVGRASSSNIGDGWISVEYPKTGYHLYTITCAADGTLCAYVDDGSTYKATNAEGTKIATGAFGNGFQIGSTYQGSISWMSPGVGMALAAVRGYDVVLQPEEVAVIAESLPATDGNVTWNVTPDNSDNTVIVTSTTFGDSNYIGQSKGTLTIPAGSEVNVKHIRVLNNNATGDRATVNIAGTLNITSMSSDPNVWYESGSNKGILWGHWHGQATYNITGSLIGENAYLETVYTAEAQTINIDGGRVSVKGIYAGNANSTINLTNGGTLEVAEIPGTGTNSSGVQQATAEIALNFRYGTYRQKATGTVTHTMTFTGTQTEPTTLDPYSCEMTVNSMSGSGYVTVADSSDGGNGKVYFNGSSGTIILTDANAGNINISGYTGTVLCQGTEATTIAMFDRFAGTVYFTGNVNATGIDLSGATVHIADGCTFTAVAGKEGALVLGSGATVTLNVTEDVANYEGYFPTVSGSGTISYYQTDGTPGELTGADHVNGNNLMPYYNVWVPSANGENNTISADAAARWRLGRLPDANKNVAFKLSGDTTVTIDATITFKDVQVYGTGSLTIQQSGDNVLTVGKGLYTTANAGIEIDSGLEFADYTKLEVESVLPRYVAVNCGTDESPFVISTVTGSGMLYITADHALASVSLAVGTLYVDGSVAIYGSGSATTASVYAGGVIDVSSGTSLTVPTLTVNGTLAMGGKTLSATTVDGTGRVEYTNKLPDSSSWSTGTASSGWRGTVAVSGYVHNGNVNKVGWTVGDWGNTYSTLEVSNCAAWYVDNASAGPALKLAGDFQINDGGSAYVTVFASLSGSGTLTVSSGTSATHTIKFGTAEAFSGSIVNGKFKVVIGSSGGENSTISVDDSKVINLADGKSLQSTNIKISGTVNIAGAGALQGAATFNSGATLKFDDIGTSESPKKLTLSSTLTFASGTVKIAFGEDAGLYDGAKLIEWSAAPDGAFAFADSGLSDDWILVKEATGLRVYSAHIKDASDGDAGTVRMESDGSFKATVSPTGAAVTLGSYITKLEVSVTANAFGTLTAPGVEANTVVVKYGDLDTTAAYTITKNGSNVLAFALDPEGVVAGVSVTPALDNSSPIAVAPGAATPTFKVKTIPGVWYAVKYSDTVSGLSETPAMSEPIQATGSSTNVGGAVLPGSGAKYYKIAAGATSAME